MNGLVDKIGLSEQNFILQEAKAVKNSLPDLLKKRGLSYDDMRYEKYCELPPECLIPIETLDSMEQLADKIPAVSFFSGAGGFDIGFHYAGFENMISIEINEIFCNTLRFNNPNKAVIGPPFYSGDIRNREELAAALIRHGVSENFSGVFHGGPPCQSFSIAANQRFSKQDCNFKRRGFDDEEKGSLIFDYIWFIKKFRPVAFLIENVPGIMECDAGGRITKALNDLAESGYTITEPKVINAANYGVPQNRMRWIVAGTRSNKKIIFPEPSHTATPCGSVFLRPVKGVENHMTRKHKSESIERYVKLAYGARDPLGRVDRLDPRLPSKTVIAGGTGGGGRSHLHPFIPRTLSVRECARLQTFPDSYIFTGTNARQFTQVGNAVPPLLAYKLAMGLKDSVFPSKQIDSIL